MYFPDIKFRLDVDLNPPNLNVRNTNDYDGNNTVKRNFLENNRKEIVNWVDEWIKTLDMRAAIFLGGKRSIRLRLVNRNKVLAEQVRQKPASIKLNITISF